MTALVNGQQAPTPEALGGPISLVTSTMLGGGAQRVVAKLASGIAARGHEVDLVLAHPVGPFLAELHPDVRVVDLGVRRLATAIVPLARYLRERRPAVVFSALDYVNVVTIAARAVSRVDVPLVVSEHNTLSQAVAHTSSRRTRLMPRLIAWSYPRADAVVAVSKGVADDLLRMCDLAPESVHVLNNPIVGPEVAQMRAEPVQHPWLVERTTPVVVAVGRLKPQKDYSTLLEAFALVRRDRDARLVILGEGPLRDQLEEQVQRLGLADAVSLPGFCPNPYPAMATADVYVLSSRWEGSPTVLVEALSCGTPVVSTDCPSGPRETLDEGRYGLLVSVEDPEGLAAGIVRALDGAVPSPPRESWEPFAQDAVVTAYLRFLAGLRTG